MAVAYESGSYFLLREDLIRYVKIGAPHKKVYCLEENESNSYSRLQNQILSSMLVEIINL